MESKDLNAYPISVRTNTLIAAAAGIVYCYLQWQASHLANQGWLLPVALLFGLTMIPVYSLIHEAEHGLFHPAKAVNYIGGNFLCVLFIAPFSFFRHCHLNHHKHNRTDVEMWDLYYEHQNRVMRYGNLYGMMVGFGYIMLPVSVLVTAIHPPLLYTKLFTTHTEMNGFLEGSKKPEKMWLTQRESLAVIAFQFMLFLGLDLQPGPYCLLLLTHGFVWSSQNYVNHAFAPRDVINGAHNHLVSPWLKFLYLNFNVHLAHHQNPGIPWIHLASLVSEPSAPRISFLKAYINLWKGPKLTHEKPPRPLHAATSSRQP